MILKDFKGFSLYEKWFFSIFMCLQLFVFVLPLWVGEAQGIGMEGILNLVASISGVACVFMAAKGRISTYFFGVIQVCTYGYLSFKAHFMGEVGMQAVFLIFQFIGFAVWIRHMKKEPSATETLVKEVDARGLTAKTWTITVVTTLIIYFSLVMLLHALTGDFYAQHPWVDGASTALSIVGQILMTFRFKEQWFFWIAVNVISIILWGQAFHDAIQTHAISYSAVAMILMWLAFLINSIYGYIQWRQNQQRQLESLNTHV